MPAVPMKVEVKEEPGYGEEPDTAAPPDSFDDYAAGTEDSHAQNYDDEPQNMDRFQGNMGASARDEPLQMKEDG